jgi:ssDNA-binding Zn-finger/Zn-ribbon topoisomerase 1
MKGTNKTMAKKRISFKTAPCPKCGAIGSLRRIIWGMPSSDIDFEKYAIGGCLIPENPHEIACSECPWSGWRGSLIPEDRTHRMPKDSEN